jgi:class 3 adenylate cyclase/predicted ATPase
MATSYTPISEWLQKLGLGQYEQAFIDNDIDLSLIAHLSEQDLEKLGVSSMGHRKKLLGAISQLDEPATPPSTGATQVLATDKAERRQLTIMFCDLVASTELSQKLDPEALRELMGAYQKTCGQVIEEYDGHIAQYLGDGLMVYFGWPRAHEDDAERAIRAGLDIVEAVKQVPAPEPLRVRVGISTGPVVVGEAAGGDASLSKLAVGETPNVAARIQGLAEPDQIIIGPDTRNLVGGTFNLSDFGEHTVKGIIEPIRTWHVTGIAESEGRFDARRSSGGLTPLIGRDLELGLLMDRWAQAQEGEGQVVLLSGEPGIGKSRILSALRERLESEGVQTLRLQCSPYYVNRAFWPNIDNVERALRFDRDESAESKLDKLESLIVGQYERPFADVRFIAAMLSIPCEDRYGPVSMTPQKFKDETARILVDLTEAAARKQPSMLLFEDAQWSDPTTLEAVDLLIDRVRTIPLLVVLTHRPEFQKRWGDHGHVSALDLSKLTRAQSSAIVSNLTGNKPLPGNLLEQILAKTDGVPLFVEELTKSILESGELKDAGKHYEYAGNTRSVTIPATLRDSLMARLDRFAPVKEIAQIGAAIGREFSYELISAIAPLPRDQLDEALTQLTDSGLAFRRGTPPEAVYMFKHALVQEAAYDSLLNVRRQELHGKIAKILEERYPQTKDTEPEVLAHHLSAAGRIEAAVPLWQKAGELALKRMALTEAISHLEKGLAIVDAISDAGARTRLEIALNFQLGAALVAARGFIEPAQVALERALALSEEIGSADDQLKAAFGLWQLHNVRGEFTEAHKLANRLLDLADLHREEHYYIQGHHAAWTTNIRQGNLTTAHEHASRGREIYHPQRHREHKFIYGGHDPGVCSRSLGGVTLWLLGFPDQARQIAQDAVELARSLAHPMSLAQALTMGSWVAHMLRDLDTAKTYAAEAVSISSELGLAMFFGRAQLINGWATAVDDEPEVGLRIMHEGIATCRKTQAAFGIPFSMTLMAGILLENGLAEEAAQIIDEAVHESEELGEYWWYPESLRCQGIVMRATGAADDTETEAAFSRAMAAARESQAKSLELRAATSLAHLWKDQGKAMQARDLLTPIYKGFTEGLDTKDLKDAKSLLNELSV